MCLSEGDVNPLCDECWDKARDKKWNEMDLCEGCKELMERYCWCCQEIYKTKEEAEIIDGSCKKCREE